MFDRVSQIDPESDSRLCRAGAARTPQPALSDQTMDLPVPSRGRAASVGVAFAARRSL